MNTNNMNKVITTTGIKDIIDVCPGDELYEYGTCKKLMVKEIVKIKSPMVNVFYSDGRVQHMTEEESDLLSMETPIKLCEFEPNKIVTPEKVDPYTQGALLVYGNQSDKYLNFGPGINPKVRGYIWDMYKIRPSVEDGKTYFYSQSGEKVTWKEFFGSWNYHNKLFTSIYYNTMSMKDRWKFIRGVFDAGAQNLGSNPFITIAHENHYKLHLVELMLYSMGIATTQIEYSEKYKINKLSIFGGIYSYPSFFYDLKYIDKCIDGMYSCDILYSDGRIMITEKEYLDEEDVYVIEFMDGQRHFYTDASFLSRLSI